MMSEGIFMKVSYDRLWKLLIDKKMNKTQLRDAVGMSSSTIAKMSKEQEVAMPILMRICKTLDCNIEDIIEFVEE